ncbi:hypothetical protein ARGLB_073_00360 [Arthrobacter globiformis NBRC 12137]|uniref:DUF1616 domain-containing protein n=1 Tax=Arthrobacter globiformis (strain ATCC 8010 / DSM 20124 / JCM 1332 / NBRC 12137 / NCIMB 8907 / NRRL B-2979 / 168) TaxID=1077972 RepID=H0QNW6_ARTG1|nr:hypothetical protein [Arthrobacter globiformis]GAB14517.1 hypothetical protein ARGLB_073_00360 [Arthrobacter globiformis NBRC 12137]
MAIDRKHIAWVVAAVAVAAVPLSFFGPEGLRMLVIGLLMLAGPGTALVLYIRLGSAGTDGTDDADGAGAHRSAAQSTLPLAISIAVASSLALSTIVATAMVFARMWSPPVAVLVLSLITLLLLALGAKRFPVSAAGAS